MKQSVIFYSFIRDAQLSVSLSISLFFYFEKRIRPKKVNGSNETMIEMHNWTIKTNEIIVSLFLSGSLLFHHFSILKDAQLDRFA